MATLNGISYKTLLVGEGSNAQNAPQIKWGGLYLGSKKLATVLLEKNIPDCEPATQLFMMYGYSEGALRAALEAEWGKGYTPADLVEELLWLEGLEKEFNRHVGQSNGGMLVLTFDNSQLTMGIPAQMANASDQTLMASLSGKLQSSERLYGPLQNYMIFHTAQDFNRGRMFTQEELSANA